MMFADCCKDCVPPKRSVHCHATCEDYLGAKATHEAQVSAERAAKKAAQDADSVAFMMNKGMI